MAMSNDSASAGAALFAATNMSMFAMIEANRAAQRQQTIMAVLNNKEYVMDNKLIQQLKDEGIEITVTVMDNFGIKGRIVDSTTASFVSNPIKETSRKKFSFLTVFSSPKSW